MINRIYHFVDRDSDEQPTEANDVQKPSATALGNSNPRTSSLVYLSPRERQILTLVCETKLRLLPATRRRACTLLMADRATHPDTTDANISQTLGISRATVAATRKRYTKMGAIDAVSPYTQEIERIKSLIHDASRLTRTQGNDILLWTHEVSISTTWQR